MNDRQRLTLQRFNWIGGLVMLAVYVLLNLFVPEMHVVLKLLIALAAALLAFALVEALRRSRRRPEDEDKN